MSVVTLDASATYPQTVSVHRTITERVELLQLYEVVEKRYEEPMPATAAPVCPAVHDGELKLELVFRESPEGEPVAMVRIPDNCEMFISIVGHAEVERLGPQLLVTQLERLLGLQL